MTAQKASAIIKKIAKDNQWNTDWVPRQSLIGNLYAVLGISTSSNWGKLTLSAKI